MKLAVIFTGGTISSLPDDGFLSPSDTTKNMLIKALDPDICVEGFQPFYILSEQLNGEYLTQLIKCAGELINGDYDGIIVTHGTDTLQYSAAALHLAFSDSKIPVVFVSSNYILTDSRSNGSANFKYAVEFIKLGIGGVYVSYKNEGGAPSIYTADSLLPHNACNDALTALNGACGYFDGKGFIRLREASVVKGRGVYTLSKNSRVLWLRIHPGMTYPSAEGYKAVLLEGYHSGTLPTEDKAFIEFCRDSSVPIYLTGAEDEVKYKSAKTYQQLNIVVLKKTSPIYAYISLWSNF